MTDFPPRIDDLLARFLARRQDEPDAAQFSGDVEAYEAVPAQSVDPRQAWDGGLEALTGKVPAKNVSKLPTGWATFVAGLESISALPMAAANFPQAVRDLLPLVKSADLSTTLKPTASADFAGLSTWVRAAASSGDAAKTLLAAGLLRLSSRFDEAERLLNAMTILDGWRTAWMNEHAALAWHRGDHATARAAWIKLPTTPATEFNRGMAELFLGNAAAARPHLQAAAEQLPESGGWHHLARLYLALAESR